MILMMIRAVEAHKAGKLEEAEELYRTILKENPNDPDANYILGILISYVNNLVDALPLLKTALEANPKQEQNWISYINAQLIDNQPETARLGLMKDKEIRLSVEQLDALNKKLAPESEGLDSDQIHPLTYTKLRKKFSTKKEKKKLASTHRSDWKADGPSNAEVKDLLSQYQGRQYESAVKLAVAMTQNYPKHQFAWKVLGAVFQASGKQNSAIVAHEKAISLIPNDAEAHSNLGVSLKDLGRLEDAEASYRRALVIKPNFSEVHYNLGNLLRDLGRYDEALEAVSTSLKIKPSAYAKNNFVDISKYVAPKSWDTSLSEMVIAALIDPWARPLYVMFIACRLLKLEAGFRSLLSQANEYLNQGVDFRFLDSFVANPLESSALLHAMLSSSHINDHELERLFTLLRHHFLVKVSSYITDNFECNDIPTLYCYLAQQCFINEYVYFESEEEIEQLQIVLNRLKTALEREEKIPAYLVVSAACYVPLHSVLGAERLLKLRWQTDVASVLKQQIQEPLEELSLRPFIPCLTSTENKVSLEVQRMYEENPYPRWVRLPKEIAERTLNAHVRELLCSEVFRPLSDDSSPQILVAGCGTGQHPIGTAQLIKGAKVLAIDLSMASLSYAKRKTDQLGIKNIEYAQADLLKLGSLGLSFDLIESSGVLHHLENPFEGLKVLQSLLKPNGLMKLGFYSELARKDIVKVRDMIAKEGVGFSAQEIRSYRKHLLELQKSEDFEISTNNSDFFSTSACRDLLFHVQEHRMIIPKLSNFFHSTDFSFLGFEIESSLRQSYKNRFPNDPSATDLNNWHIYEEENPETFIGMYQFWIQKNSSY